MCARVRWRARARHTGRVWGRVRCRSPQFTDSCSGCEVADGFFDSWSALRSQVVAALAAIPHSSVVFTGHSVRARAAAAVV